MLNKQISRNNFNSSAEYKLGKSEYQLTAYLFSVLDNSYLFRYKRWKVLLDSCMELATPNVTACKSFEEEEEDKESVALVKW